MNRFKKKVKVRFADTDAAGIMFYPRYFGMINDLVEDWFDEGLGFDFAFLHLKAKRSVPTAHIEADFLHPSKMHDTLTFEIAVTKLGTSSCALAVKARCGTEQRIKASLVIVHMDMETGKTLPWPDDMRHQMSKWMAAENDNSTGGPS